MATWSEGEDELPCQKCGAVHIVKYKDGPWRDTNEVDCLVPGCGDIVIRNKSSRDYGQARLKESNA